MLQVKDLCKEYSRGNKKFLALDNVSLEIHSGDFVNIIGRSGSGKSTLLNIMAGMLSPSSGSVFFHGEDISKKDDEQLSQIRNTKIGFIPQGASALPNLNVLENILLPACLYYSNAESEDYAHFLLERFNIADLHSSYPSELSGGELRRALIARALINKPDIIIADEPVSDLDVRSADEVMKIFAELNSEGVTLLLVSHDLDSLKYSQKIYTMHEGKLTRGNILSKCKE